MVGFIPLDISDEEGIVDVLAQVRGRCLPLLALLSWKLTVFSDGMHESVRPHGGVASRLCIGPISGVVNSDRAVNRLSCCGCTLC